LGYHHQPQIEPAASTIPNHMDYLADHTPVVHVPNSTHPREEGFNALKPSLIFANEEPHDDHHHYRL
jgi:hypothetical protein